MSATDLQTTQTVRLTLTASAAMVVVYAVSGFAPGGLALLAAGGALLPGAVLGRYEWRRSLSPLRAVMMGGALALLGGLSGLLAPRAGALVAPDLLDGVLRKAVVLAVLLALPAVGSVALNSVASRR